MTELVWLTVAEAAELLRTKKLSPVEYNPTASADLFRAFLLRTFAGDHATIRFVQKAFGYSLTGETRPFPYDDPLFGLPKRDDLAFVVLEKAL